MSTFWFKNNMNSMSRNLACNSPAPVLGAWYVPQKTNVMRGPSTICIGSKKLDLPGMSPHDIANARGSEALKGLDGCDVTKLGHVNGPSYCHTADDCRCLSGFEYDPTIRSTGGQGNTVCYIPGQYMRTIYENTAPGYSDIEFPGMNASYMQICSVQTGSTCQSGFSPSDGHVTVKHNRSVLVVEAPDTIQTVPVYLSNTVTRLLGVVVRRGGVLFMDDVDSELDLHFMIVESGGLFQAGSRHSAAHRFQSHLVIQYEHEYWVDAGNAPLTASQYSVEVLHPGVKLEPTNVVYNVKINQTMTTYNVSKQVRDFTGSLGNNYGVAKGLAVFFNGNYQLNSVVPGRVPYAGTWNVDRTCPSDQNCHMDVRETVREAEAPLTEDEDAYHVAFEYPMTWARLGRPHHTGDRYLVLNVKDCSNDGWQAGDRVVLTAASAQFADSENSVVGAPRIWMDHDNKTKAHRDNVDALNKYKDYFTNDNTGVEVVTLAGTVNKTTFMLKSPLMYDHYVGIERLSNLHQQADVHVGTH
eukprot:gene32294-40892_t